MIQEIFGHWIDLVSQTDTVASRIFQLWTVKQLVVVMNGVILFLTVVDINIYSFVLFRLIASLSSMHCLTFLDDPQYEPIGVRTQVCSTALLQKWLQARMVGSMSHVGGSTLLNFHVAHNLCIDVGTFQSDNLDNVMVKLKLNSDFNFQNDFVASLQLSVHHTFWS